MPLVAGGTKLSELTYDEFKSLIDEAVVDAIARASISDPASEFLSSRNCASLLGVTPEHLCSMRARGEGPPWSGEGKWVRYHRGQVLRWLSGLPRRTTSEISANPRHAKLTEEQ